MFSLLPEPATGGTPLFENVGPVIFPNLHKNIHGGWEKGATFSKLLRKILGRFLILEQSLTISGKTLTRHNFALLSIVHDLTTMSRVQHDAKISGSYQGRRKQFTSGGHIWRARYRERITGVWGRSPQRGPGAAPLVRGSGGEAPLKLKAFLLLDVL